MAGLVPAIHVLHHLRMSGGYVYILASAPNGILYVGVTSDLVRRIYEHRNDLIADLPSGIQSSGLFISSITMTFSSRSSANTTSSTGRENGK
jgi:predicted GIY-YIG superfamily endonuclease